MTSFPLGRPAAPPARAESRSADADQVIGRARLAVRVARCVAALAVARGAVVRTGVRREFESLGLGAVPLVATSAVLIGLIATFQVASQLSVYGAQAVSITALGWFGARELGPIAVSLLLVSRSAPGIAGELASMRVNGEIDALRAMGLDPVKYLVAPKLVAICVALPLLTVIADGLITLGGWLGCQLFLRLGTAFFLEQFRGAFSLADLAVGLVKSVLFALIIVLTAAHEGFNVPNRVAAIGEAARRAVLACVIAVLGADTVVNAVVYFIPRLGTV